MSNLSSRIPILENLPVIKETPESPGTLMEFEPVLTEEYKNKSKIWMDRIKNAKMRYQDFYRDAKEAMRVYKNKSDSPIYTNIFHSNVKALVAYLYPDQAKPIVRPEGTGNPMQDKINQKYSNIVQKFLENTYDKSNFDKVQRKKIWMGQVAGWGCSRIYLDDDPMTNTKRMVWQAINYNDIYFPDVDSFEDVNWIIQRHKLTEDELAQWSNDDTISIATDIPSVGEWADDLVDEDDHDNAMTKGDKFIVYEIWDKVERKRYFLRDIDGLITFEEDDPYNLDCFFPFSEPFIPIEDMGMIPIPSYNIYRELHEDLQLTYKKDSDTIKQIALKYLSTYTSPKMQQFVTSSQSKVFVDPHLTKEIARAGPTKTINDIFLAFPWQDQVEFSRFLKETRVHLKLEMNEISMVSDIVSNGQTDADETATAQKLKIAFDQSRLKGQIENAKRSVEHDIMISAQLIHSISIQEVLEKTKYSLQPSPDMTPDEIEQKMQESEAILAMLQDPSLGKMQVKVQSMSMSVVDDQINMEKDLNASALIEKMIALLAIPMIAQSPQAQLGVINYHLGLISDLRLDSDTQRNLTLAIEPVRTELEQEVERLQDPEYAQQKAEEDRQNALNSDPKYVADKMKNQLEQMKEQNKSRELENQDRANERADKTARYKIDQDNRVKEKEIANKWKEVQLNVVFRKKEIRQQDEDLAIKRKAVEAEIAIEKQTKQDVPDLEDQV